MNLDDKDIARLLDGFRKGLAIALEEVLTRFREARDEAESADEQEELAAAVADERAAWDCYASGAGALSASAAATRADELLEERRKRMRTGGILAPVPPSPPGERAQA